MDIKKATEYATTQQVIDDARQDLVEEMRSYTPELTSSTEFTPLERFNNLWQRGMTLLETDTDCSGTFELEGHTESGVPLKIELHLTNIETPFGDFRRKIEADWAGGSSYKEIGKHEFVNSSLAEYHPESPSTLEGLTALELTMTAAEELAGQMRAEGKEPLIIVYASSGIKC